MSNENSLRKIASAVVGKACSTAEGLKAFNAWMDENGVTPGQLKNLSLDQVNHLIGEFGGAGVMVAKLKKSNFDLDESGMRDVAREVIGDKPDIAHTLNDMSEAYFASQRGPVKFGE